MTSNIEIYEQPQIIGRIENSLVIGGMIGRHFRESSLLRHGYDPRDIDAFERGIIDQVVVEHHRWLQIQRWADQAIQELFWR